jgi:perosamine synthetase
MTNSKQIIYPLSYLGLSLAREKVTEKAFEEHLTRFLGAHVYVKVIGRARAGIYVLTKLAVQHGRRKVILSPYTIPDVVNMVKFAGAEPVFVDVLPYSTNIDLDHLVSLMDEETCCVIVTHYHFNQTSMAKIFGLCASKGIMLVEDSALSFGGSSNGAPMECTSDASVFSFSGFKTLNFLWGGAIATRSPELANRLCEEINTWPRLRWPQYFKQMLRIMKYDVLTRNPVFSAITFPLLKRRAQRNQADILPVMRVESTELDNTILSKPPMQAIREWDRKLGAVKPFLQHRRSIAKIYFRELRDHLVSNDTSTEVRDRSCLVNCPIHVDPERRTAIYKKIFASGFDVGLSLYPNVHELPGFQQIAGRSQNVSQLVRSVITLPTHPRISEEYARRLATVVQEAIRSA